jgi:uncharacterized protein (TIGR00304 family)
MKELASIGIIVIFLGIVLVMIGIISEITKQDKKVETRGGGIVMIGPIPIIFGTDTGSVKTVMVLAIVLIALVLILTRWRV